MILLGAAPTILPGFPTALRERAARDLRQLGVEIHVGTMATGVDHEGIDTSAKESHVRRIEAATKIWAAGVHASPLGRILAEAQGVELDRAGRVTVEPDCTLPGHPEVFVIGDLMSLDRLPGSRDRNLRATELFKGTTLVKDLIRSKPTSCDPPDS